jgi:hypothetical protein
MPQSAVRKDTPIAHDHGATGGGADCMFDYLISECWTGREGKVFQSLTGCDFRVYSYIEGALDHASALGVQEHRVFFICGGTYAETIASIDVPDGASWDIIGAGSSSTIMAASANSETLLHFTTMAANLNVYSEVRISGIYFDMASYTGCRGVSNLNGSNGKFWIRDCKFRMIGGTSAGIEIQNTINLFVDRCSFYGDSDGNGGFGIVEQGGVTPIQRIVITQCLFDISYGIGPVAGSGVFGNTILIEGNQFYCNEIGVIVGTGAKYVINGNHFAEHNDGEISTAAGGGIKINGGPTENIIISDNTFNTGGGGIDGEGFAIRVVPTAVSDQIAIIDNTFDGDGGILIPGGQPSGAFVYSYPGPARSGVITGNTFNNITDSKYTIAGYNGSGAIIYVPSGVTMQVYHNSASDGSGTDIPLADVGPVVGHSTAASRQHTLLDNGTVHTDTATGNPTKGDLIVGSGTQWDDLAVGTDGHVLTADSAQALGVKWAASAGGSGHTIQEQSVSLGTQRSLLDFLGTYQQAVDDGVDATAVFGGYAHYDAIVDSTQYNALATTVPVYTTLQAAITAGHTSILFRQSTDGSAITSTGSVSYIVGDTLSGAAIPVNLTVDNTCLLSNLNFQNVALTLSGTGATAQACLFSGTTTVTMSGSGASMIACAGVSLSAATAITVSGSDNRVQASRFTTCSCATTVIDLASAASRSSIVGNIWQGSSEAGYFLVNNAANGTPVISGNAFSFPSTATGVASINTFANVSGNLFTIGSISSGTKTILNNATRCVVTGNTFSVTNTTSTAVVKLLVTASLSNGTVFANNVILSGTLASTAQLIFVEDGGEGVIVSANSYTQTGSSTGRPIFLNSTGTTNSYIFTGNFMAQGSNAAMSRMFPVSDTGGTTAISGLSKIYGNGSGLIDIRTYRYE